MEGTPTLVHRNKASYSCWGDWPSSVRPSQTGVFAHLLGNTAMLRSLLFHLLTSRLPHPQQGRHTGSQAPSRKQTWRVVAASLPPLLPSRSQAELLPQGERGGSSWRAETECQGKLSASRGRRVGGMGVPYAKLEEQRLLGDSHGLY